MIFRRNIPEWLTSRPIAHRGLHQGKEIPENSIASFELAIEKGHPIELDIHILKDNSIAVFHDRDLLRLCGKDLLLKHQTAVSIKEYFLCDTNQKIPLLSEVLNLVSGKVPLLIEIKNFNWPGRMEEQVLKVLRDYKGEFAVQSFNPFTPRWFRKNAPEIFTGQLATGVDYHEVEWWRHMATKYLLVTLVSRPDFIGYDIESIPNLPTRIVKKLGIPLLAWTVRNEEQRSRAALHCNNIIFENHTD